jgi:hypothetical protein
MGMGPKIDWTMRDARLLALREKGLTWQDIGKLIGVGKDTARKRFQLLHGMHQSARAGAWKPSGDLIRIREVCAEAFGVRDEDLVRRIRVRQIVLARQAACYVIRAVRPKLSYPCIGATLGGLDHSTVIHGARATAALIERDPEVARRVASLLAIFACRADSRQHDAHVVLYREALRLRLEHEAGIAVRRREEAERRARAEAKARAQADDDYVAALDPRRIPCGQCDRSVLPTEAARCSARLCGLRPKVAA